jgi:hypothetical protein
VLERAVHAEGAKASSRLVVLFHDGCLAARIADSETTTFAVTTR